MRPAARPSAGCAVVARSSECPSFEWLWRANLLPHATQAGRRSGWGRGRSPRSIATPLTLALSPQAGRGNKREAFSPLAAPAPVMRLGVTSSLLAGPRYAMAQGVMIRNPPASAAGPAMRRI